MGPSVSLGHLPPSQQALRSAQGDMRRRYCTPTFQSVNIVESTRFSRTMARVPRPTTVSVTLGLSVDSDTVARRERGPTAPRAKGTPAVP